MRPGLVDADDVVGGAARSSRSSRIGGDHPVDDVDLLDRLADRFVAGDRAVDIDRPELPADAAGAKPRHVGHQRLGRAMRRCRWRGGRPCSRNFRAVARAMSLWPSISGVFLRMRSIRAWTLRVDRLGGGGRGKQQGGSSSKRTHRYFPHGQARGLRTASAKRNAAAMWILFDDARDGGARAAAVPRAASRRSSRDALDEVVPALERVRAAVARRARMRRAVWPMKRGMRSIPSWRRAFAQGDGPLLCVRAVRRVRDARPRRRCCPSPDGALCRHAAAADRAGRL